LEGFFKGTPLTDLATLINYKVGKSGKKLISLRNEMKLKKPLQRLLKLFLPRPREKKEFTVFHEDDLEGILQRFALLHAFREGNLKCAYCQIRLTKYNLYCIFSHEGQIRFCCDKLECRKQLVPEQRKEL